MGRHLKKGLDYFNVDCNQEDNLTLVEAKHGIAGYGTVIKLWKKCYQLQGYFAEWDEKNIYLFAREIAVEVAFLKKVIETCFEEGIFSRPMFSRYKILTSAGIQKRWKKIVTDAKRKEVEITSKYCLLTVFSEETQFTPEEIANTPEVSTQRKVKKNKVNKRKVTQKPSSTILSKTTSAPASPAPVKKIAKDEQPESHWQQLVDTFFVFYKEKFHEDPSFSRRDPRLLKDIVIGLRKRADRKKIGWTEDNAVKSLKFFLACAYSEDWLSKHFLLKNLSEQFDAVFQRQAAGKNGTSVAAPVGDQEVESLYQRFLLGDLDPKAIEERYFDHLHDQGMIDLDERFIAQAVKTRINNLQGGNQAIDNRIVAAYQNGKWPSDPDCLADKPLRERIAKRYALYSLFQAGKDLGATTVKDIQKLFADAIAKA